MMTEDEAIVALEKRRKQISESLGLSFGSEHAALHEEHKLISEKLGRLMLARDKRQRPGIYAAEQPAAVMRTYSVARPAVTCFADSPRSAARQAMEILRHSRPIFEVVECDGGGEPVTIDLWEDSDG